MFEGRIMGLIESCMQNAIQTKCNGMWLLIMIITGIIGFLSFVAIVKIDTIQHWINKRFI